MILFIFQHSHEEWCRVFYISAALYSFGGIFFLIFATGKVQPWATSNGNGVETADDREMKQSLKNGTA